MLPALFIVYGVAVFVFFLFGLLRVRAVWRLEQRLSVAARHLPGVKALARRGRGGRLMHPIVFFAYPVVVLIFFAGWYARDRRALRRATARLSVPAKACDPGAESSVVPPPARPSSRRDGQRVRPDAQERAARDVLCCRGGGVDVAPVRCPLEGGE